MTIMHALQLSALAATVLSGLSGAAPASQLTDSSITGVLGSSFGIPGRDYEFDYVVVGGGQAGLAVAARLAEDKSLTIGVIEAGDFYELTNGNLSEIPSDAAWFVGKDTNDWQPAVDWGFITEPQQALNDVKAHYPRGRTLGGSSARNFMAYHLATKGSYDQLAKEADSPAYSFDKFFKYFTKSQKFTPPVGGTYDRFTNSTPQYDPSKLGTQGAVSVIYPKYAQPFSTWARKGLEAIGIKSQRGFESGKLSGGYSYALASIRREENTRESSETAYLRPHLGGHNPNLITFISTLAKKVVFDGQKRATGVLVDTLGLQYTIRARKEVIVSAGAFQSPQLLMVSGIGPKDILEKYGIEVLQDSPGVGQNMKDHVLIGTSYRVNVRTAAAFGDPAQAALFEKQYAQGNGPMTSNGVDLLGWERLPRKLLSNATASALESSFASDWPDVEYLPDGAFFGNVSNLQLVAPNDGYQYATMLAGLVATLSKGNVTIRSNDTADLPVINPNWLSHPADKEVAIAAFKRTREIWTAPAMRPVLIGEEYYPGKSVSTDEEIWRYIQDNFSTIFHAACTCKMGPASDKMSVLDANARVRGVTGLRVVDASSLPILPPGHPVSTIYALAEKIADDIRHGN
ncbi:putative GMC oxidoreductase [Daldinia caldariorum]|uniref:putative GMC oxidoreductase n=1 Tax=Daldinia caldariorum TaxID=326644 RepID=UPI002008E9FB|nr:putative GMC oxidoreductase [Daldinia caldariorum]KAI1471134.1 putative GMC oxidoreductase [Daldinia caldariorum]